MAILRDITEERTVEARLREREKLEAVGRLAGGIAHDFNNILSGILGHAELSLLETEGASSLHDHQERIREAALRARALVQQILAFGQKDSANLRVVGTGMDEETRARLFEPYMTTKGRSGGHGLGLAVVHGIVAAAGGVIRVDSAPRQAAGRGERILLVEDEPLVRNTHRRVLESLGYAVDVAENGEVALEGFRLTPEAWDLILTDQSMPKLAGEDLARAVREIRPSLPVLLCTGYSERLDDEARQALGVRAILQKPIGRDALAEAVRAALEGT